jgi:hypothetical protein
VERAAVGGDDGPRCSQQRRQIVELAGFGSELRTAPARLEHRSRETLLARLGPRRHQHPFAIARERTRQLAEACGGPPLVRGRGAAARMQHDRRRPRPERLRHGPLRRRRHRERRRTGCELAVHDRAHQRLVALEARQSGAGEPHAVGGEPMRPFARDRRGVAEPIGRTAEASEQRAACDRVEVEHEVVAAGAELAREARKRSSGLQQAPAPQRRDPPRAWEHEHAIDEVTRRNDRCGALFDQPVDPRSRCRVAQQRYGRQRAHDVSHRTESNHQDALDARQDHERVEHERGHGRFRSSGLHGCGLG